MGLNYFRIGRSVIFFDDEDPIETRAAWDAAQAIELDVKRRASIFRRAFHAGPWDTAAVIIGEYDRTPIPESRRVA